LAAALLAVAVRIHAQEPPGVEPGNASEEPGRVEESDTGEEDEATELDELIVEGDRPRSAASSDEIRARDFQLRPHSTLQEILNNVPGLIVRQHQGGGKANQYLIRGFNADHGTDFLVTVDGLPVNMPSHGHGQGYADTNFIIPETIARLRLRKGPYFVEEGNFANAGSLDMITLDEFPEDFALAEGGSFDRQRYVVGVSPKLGQLKTLFAGQAYWSNGPFEHPEHFARYNAYGKLTWEPGDDLTLWAAGTYYAADWDASGQIPQREVSQGRLDRFGAIDPTEGGQSDRQNLDLHGLWKPTKRDEFSTQAWISRYHMRLFSNFTFFQDTGLRFYQVPGVGIVDTRGGPAPANGFVVPGDGIEQLDDRWIYGGRAAYTRAWELGNMALATKVGVETRNDTIDVSLSRQVKRRSFFTVSDVAIDERTMGFFVGQELIVNEYLRFDGGVRGDVFWWKVRNRLNAQAPDPNFEAVPLSGHDSDAIVSPKLNVIISPRPDTDIYLNVGGGFHSNDARGIIQSGTEPNQVPLARAWGYEVGARTRQLNDRLDLASALWLIDLQSEIVFCGDCGTIEGTPRNFDVGPATRRWGVDFEARYKVNDWLYADYDLSWADPRFKNGDAIPVAPTLFMNGGLTAEFANGFSTAARIRFLDDRPGTEDRLVTARGYLVMDLFAKYRWRNVEFGLDLLNLGDFDWQEAVFVDTSCTAREVRLGQCPSKRDVHFTPGDPFAVRGRVTVFF
jgi:outer membrane receptor protein involved in Fe transport